MPFFSEFRLTLIPLSFLVGLCTVSSVSAVMDPRFEIDAQTLSTSTATAKLSDKKSKHLIRSTVSKTPSAAKGTTYIVKPGDHLFKILMRDYGLSNSEAESFIDEIRSENNILDIKRLKIGQKIVIPPILRRADGTLKLVKAANTADKKSNLPEASVGQSFVLESPISKIDPKDTVSKVRETWDKIVPQKVEQKPLKLQTTTFSLTLDPERYPVFSAMDGARILLDQNSSIPPLVKSLIEEKDSKIKIVNYTTSDTKQLMATMLGAAGFYSVEENFSMEFGVDPKLIVNADFKVEKTPESLINHDVILISSSRATVPSILNDFLKKEGFSLYEPVSNYSNKPRGESRQIHIIAAKGQPEMVDSILTAMSLPYDRDHSLNVFAADNNGISLSVKAERYFEHDGKRYVITRFDGDPVNYTLFRILETKGYRVVILEAQDDFKKVSEKIASRMKIPNSFAQHNLLQDKNLGYSLQMSGIKLDDSSLPGGTLFMTNLTMDRIIRELLTENGYSIDNR